MKAGRMSGRCWCHSRRLVDPRLLGFLSCGKALDFKGKSSMELRVGEFSASSCDRLVGYCSCVVLHKLRCNARLSGRRVFRRRHCLHSSMIGTSQRGYATVLLAEDEALLRELGETILRHAYLHRKEGDPSNASYWYSRAGRRPSVSSLDEEWEEITTALLAGSQ